MEAQKWRGRRDRGRTMETTGRWEGNDEMDGGGEREREIGRTR